MKKTDSQRKALFFQSQSESYRNTRSILLLAFYLIALLAIYRLFTKSMNIFFTLFLSILILTYPFYIFYFQKAVVVIYNYIYASILGTVVKETSI